MVTIETTPAPIVLIGNPVRLGISTHHAVSTDGIRSSMKVRVAGTDQTPNHTFMISCGDDDLTFVIAATSDVDDPLIVPVATSGDTFETWGLDIFNAFRLNYKLLKNYSIEWDLHANYADIILTAYEASEVYSLAFDALTSTGISGQSIVAGVTPVYRSNFKVLINILDEELRVIGEDSKSITAEGVASFNISEYLMAKMAVDDTARFLWPETGNSNSFAREAFILKYIACFAEFYDDATHKLVFDQLRYAIAGGISRELLVTYNNLESSYFEESINDRRFLTWAPKTKTIAIRSVEKLFFLLREPGAASFKMECKITYTDDTTYGPFNVHQLQSYATYQYVVIECLCGYTYLHLSAYQPSKTVKFWQVWIKNNAGDIVSEVRKYILDTAYQENERQLLFKNSLSAYDTIRVTGIRENNNEYERGGAFEFLDLPESFYNAPEKAYSINETVNYKASTSWLSFEEKDWLRDLLLSTEVFEIIGQKLIPVVISSKKAFISKDKEDLYSLEFEYNRANADEYYSAGLGAQNANEDIITGDSDLITGDSDIITGDQLYY